MNATELKTYRQSLWLTREAAARLFNVQDRVYRYWESGDWAIPADVEATLRRIDSTLTGMAEHARDVFSDMAHQHGAPQSAVLIRYASDEDLWHSHPGRFAHLSCTLHAAGIDRARQMLEGKGAAVRIVTMDRDAYEEWLADQKLSDNSATRAAWATTVTDPPTRAKKTSMASGQDFAK